MLHGTGGQKVIIGGVSFEKNSGYVDSNVIYIRGRGPASTDVYSPLSVGTDAYCGGYLIQKNTFTSNFGCVLTSGGVIKFECVNDLEESAATSFIDQIQTPITSTWVKGTYDTLYYTSYVATATTPSVSYSSVAY